MNEIATTLDQVAPIIPETLYGLNFDGLRLHDENYNLKVVYFSLV